MFRFFLLLFIVTMSFSCSTQKDNPRLTFEDIEKEFGFKNPLAQHSKDYILRKFENIENYREFLLEIYKKKDESKKIVPTGAKAKYNICVTHRYEAFPAHFIWFPDDQYILDTLEEYGYSLESSCRAGACGTCLALMWNGTVDQSRQSILTDDAIDNGYIVPCVAYPRSDGDLKFGVNEDLIFF